MGTFRTIARLWPTGDEIDLGTDSNAVGGPPGTTFSTDRNAAKFVTTDSHNQFEFLFWNTGRHLTRKRHVIWNFSAFNWGTWTATRWYGDPSGGGAGSHTVRATALDLHADVPIVETPIDGAHSTFPPGAWQSGGNDHLVDTQNGSVIVWPKDPMHSQQFAGWLQLLWGGEDSGDYVEGDSGTTGSFGDDSFYVPVSPGPFSVDQGGSAELIAQYAKSSLMTIPMYHLVDILTKGGTIPIYELGDILTKGGTILDVIWHVGDPVPPDLTREKFLEDFIRQTSPSPARLAGDLQHLIEKAPQMNAEELRRSITSVQNNIQLSQTALTTLEAHARRAGGGR
jgi:hypothetical protein